MRTFMNKHSTRFEHQDWGALALATLGALLALVLGTGCELTTEEKHAIEDVLGVRESDHDGSATAPASACMSERFVQPEAEVVRKIDILFVTDTSGSLADERGQVADGIDAFVSQLP